MLCSDVSQDWHLRLTSYPQGRLQVWKSGNWHTVCGHRFWSNHFGAETACKFLGFAEGGVVVNMSEETISDSDPIYIGLCKEGESIGFCTGGCCSKDCKRNSINCGDCQRDTDAVFEVQCHGVRWSTNVDKQIRILIGNLSIKKYQQLNLQRNPYLHTIKNLQTSHLGIMT
eukprot:UN32095